MKINRIIAMFIAVFISLGIVLIPTSDISTISISAQASSGTENNNKNGWYKQNGNRIYYLDGKKIISRTKLIDGKMYLFDSNGYLVKNGFHIIKGNKYYSDKNGIVSCNK